MKRIIGLLFLLSLPVLGHSQAAADTGSVIIITKDLEITPMPDMMSSYSREDKMIINNLGPNKIMKTEDYELRYDKPASPISTEGDPK